MRAMIFTVSQVDYRMLAETDICIPVKFWSGDFPSQGLNASNTGSLRLGKGLQQLNGTSGNSKCIEITAEVRDRNGSVIENCVARGSGENNVHRYTSMVYKGNSKPSRQVSYSSLPFLIFLQHLANFSKFRYRITLSVMSFSHFAIANGKIGLVSRLQNARLSRLPTSLCWSRLQLFCLMDRMYVFSRGIMLPLNRVAVFGLISVQSSSRITSYLFHCAAFCKLAIRAATVPHCASPR